MPVAMIPKSEVELLTRLRESRDLPALRRRIAYNRRAGWTLSGIGIPLGVPFSTVRAWQTAAEADDPTLTDPNLTLPADVPTPVRPPRQKGHTIRVKKIRPDVPPGERERLYQLSQDARVLRRSTRPTHPAWESQRELEKMLRTYVERNVPIAALARHCRVTNRAISARLERAALRNYTHGDSITDHLRADHDATTEEA